MKIHTDVTTLSRLYPLFKEAGIEGVLSGDLSQISELTFPDLCGKLLLKGHLPEICETITRSELCLEDDAEPTLWANASREACLGVLIPFLIDITVGPLELKQKTMNQAPPKQAISS